MRPHLLPIGVAFTVLSVLSACRSKDERQCDVAPVIDNLKFKLVDDSTGEDLLVSGIYSIDSLHIIQPGNDDSIIVGRHIYLASGTGKSTLVFEPRNISLPLPDASLQERTLYFRWNAMDTDTIVWNYHLEVVGGCQMPVMENVYYNGRSAQAFYDGLYRYYSIIK